MRGPYGVTLIDDLDSDLAAMQTGISRAGEIAGGAERGAEEVAARLAATGFVGIAQAMHAIRAEIIEIRQRIGDLGRLTRTAHAPLQAAPQQPTPQDTIAVLTPVVAVLAAIHDRIAAALTRIGEVQQHTARTLRGGQPGPMMARVGGIHTVLVAVGQRCVLAQQHAEAALNEARRSGVGTTAGDGDERASAPEPTPFVRIRPDPDAIEQIRKHVGRGVAAGRLYDVTGKPLTPIIGPGDTGAEEDLREPYRSMRFVWHVESNVTAYMRHNKIRQAVLYSNMTPCKKDDGCKANIKATLPVGYKLIVYQVHENGGITVHEFKGTGEGLIDE
jgi:hypothetical protein